MLKQAQMIEKDQALAGRPEAMTISGVHFVSGHPLKENVPENLAKAMFGMGCFWGAEKKFWQVAGVYSTAVGYSAGFTENPSYEEVCSGFTGHNKVVLVFFDEGIISFQNLLKLFWEAHNPTQGFRQGNDVGSQYRSGIYTYSQEQQEMAELSKSHYQEQLSARQFSEITTEIKIASEFYYAEEYHQQYLAKNPLGYCGLGGTDVSYS